nr:MAG TPA: hypothetical protein [Caudoviricetes sp.]
MCRKIFTELLLTTSNIPRIVILNKGERKRQPRHGERF